MAMGNAVLMVVHFPDDRPEYPQFGHHSIGLQGLIFKRPLFGTLAESPRLERSIIKLCMSALISLVRPCPGCYWVIAMEWIRVVYIRLYLFARGTSGADLVIALCSRFHDTLTSAGPLGM